MKSKSGLRAVKKSVHGKRGSVTRTYWVKASPKAEAQKGNRQISAGEMLKRHGLQIAGRGAAHGAGIYAAQIGGIQAGVRAGSFTGRNKPLHVRGLHEFVGAWGGFLGSGAAAAAGGRKLAYAGKRGAAIRTDYQRATIGGKAATVGLHIATAAAGWRSVSSAHAAQVLWSRERERKRDAAAAQSTRAAYERARDTARTNARNWGSEL